MGSGSLGAEDDAHEGLVKDSGLKRQPNVKAQTSTNIRAQCLSARGVKLRVEGFGV